MQLELKLLAIQGGTQPREKIHDEVVAEYAEAIRNGTALPPVVAFFDGCAYWLGDGFHRYHAHRQAGLDTIDVDVRDGTLRDAILYSVGANTEHGLRRTNEDKRKAVKTMLTNEMVAKDDQGKPWSNSEVAKQCQVSHEFVRQMREKLTCSVASEKSTPVSRAYVTKHGTTAVMKTTNIGKSNRRRAAAGDVAKDARKPARFHEENGPVPMRAISLPLNNPQQAAHSMISVYGEEYVRRMLEELQQIFQGTQKGEDRDVLRPVRLEYFPLPEEVKS